MPRVQFFSFGAHVNRRHTETLLKKKMLTAVLFLATCVTCLALGGHVPAHHHPHPYPWDLAYIQSHQQKMDFQHGPIPFPEPRPDFGRLRLLYSWKQVDFEFPDAVTRRRMIQNKQFIPINNLVNDVDIYGDGPNRVVLVTLPRMRLGVPATLATVGEHRDAAGQHLLRPFPDWPSNTAIFDGDCDGGVASVFRTKVDECGRLWVVDTGTRRYSGASNGAIIPCDPKLLIYDIRNDNRLIGRYPIPRSIFADDSLLVTIAVDVDRKWDWDDEVGVDRKWDCKNAFAYIADMFAYKLIVFQLRTGQFWRIDQALFSPYPDQSHFTINHVPFDMMGGIFGLSLGPKLKGRKSRRLFFQSLASVRQSWVDTAVVRNRSSWLGDASSSPGAFHLLGGRRPSQSAPTAMTDRGVMFFGLVGSNEIACWNSLRPFGGANIVPIAKDNKALQFNSGIKVYNGKLYVTTNRLQNYMANRVNAGETNYRVLAGDVRRLAEGTSCDVDAKPRPAT